MSEINFKRLFFKYYDRKIADGTITFSKLGISKADFTRLCTEEDFLPDENIIAKISVSMKLTEEEKKELLEAAGRLRQGKREE